MNLKLSAIILTVLLPFCLSAAVDPQAGAAKKVVCYYGTWATYRPGNGKFDVENLPVNLCTHIIYGFTNLGDDNRIALYDPWNDLGPGEFYTGNPGHNYVTSNTYPGSTGREGGLNALRRFTGLKSQNPSLKALVAIGGWNAGSNVFSAMAAIPSQRSIFVQSIVPFLQKYNFDGLDLDWEYPSCKADGEEDRVCAPSADKANFASLLKELKAALSPYGYLLTAALSPGKDKIDVAYDFPTLISTLDLFHVMTYDYHGAWETVTGLNSPLYSNAKYDIGNATWLNSDWTINYYLSNGLPASKIIMGNALYGRGFTLANPNNNGILAQVSGPIPGGPFSRTNGTWAYYEICTAAQQGGWNVVRDPCYQAPYAYNRNLWIGYDDVQSVTTKGQYISAMNLGGAMIWEIDFDDFRNLCGGQPFPLTNAVVSAMNQAASLPASCASTTTTTMTTTTTTTTTTPTPTPTPKPCPPYDPSIYTCTCSPTSCDVTPTPAPSFGTFDCKNKKNGNYADPIYPCNGYFWMCSNGYGYNFACANFNLVFNPRINRCDYPALVPNCSGGR